MERNSLVTSLNRTIELYQHWTCTIRKDWMTMQIFQTFLRRHDKLLNEKYDRERERREFLQDV